MRVLTNHHDNACGYHTIGHTGENSSSESDVKNASARKQFYADTVLNADCSAILWKNREGMTMQGAGGATDAVKCPHAAQG